MVSWIIWTSEIEHNTDLEAKTAIIAAIHLSRALRCGRRHDAAGPACLMAQIHVPTEQDGGPELFDLIEELSFWLTRVSSNVHGGISSFIRNVERLLHSAPSVVPAAVCMRSSDMDISWSLSLVVIRDSDSIFA